MTVLASALVGWGALAVGSAPAAGPILVAGSAPLDAFTPFAYAACLLFSLSGMLILDWRHRLFWWADARRAAIVHSAAVAAFLVWDAFGIGLGVFFRGETPYMTGLQLAPELPVEELLFLIFLSWLTMNAYTGTQRLAQHRARRARAAQDTLAAQDTRASRSTITGDHPAVRP